MIFYFLSKLEIKIFRKIDLILLTQLQSSLLGKNWYFSTFITFSTGDIMKLNILLATVIISLTACATTESEPKQVSKSKDCEEVLGSRIRQCGPQRTQTMSADQAADMMRNSANIPSSASMGSNR
ncbi:hypothetical protein [Undibacterium sp. Dicai25W]|uniref:hypothetical protein n=1 Tax=Undibacterium sp. Dicai25W TaxID=3413034 RepID=UPI003BF5D4FC